MTAHSELTVKALFQSPERSVAYDFLLGFEYPWQALPELRDFIVRLGKSLPPEEYECLGEDVWIAKSARVAPSASISGPTVIMADAEVRHCAFIRGSVLIGRGCVVGNSTELKNALLFDGVQVPHYNYVGDSILGYKSHMGAGAITSNVKSDKTLVSIAFGSERIETGQKKLGAILGDLVEVGCGSVLCPGSVIGAGTNIYPLTRVRGFVPEGSIMKSNTETVKKR